MWNRLLFIMGTLEKKSNIRNNPNHEFMKSSKIKVQFFEIISKFTPLSLYNCALHKLL